MTIINEIDENNDRTIDTETGIYLRMGTFNLRENMFSFSIFDGEVLVGINTIRNHKVDEKKKISKVKYIIEEVTFNSAVKNKNYSLIIKKLLEEYGVLFKSSERLFGYEENVHVEFLSKALEQLKSWESGKK